MFVAAFAVSLAVGRAFEFAADSQTLAAALRVQRGWISALSEMAPWEVVKTYNANLSEIAEWSREEVWTDDAGVVHSRDRNLGAAVLLLPLLALGQTILALAGAGGVAGLVQIAMAAGALALINLHWTKGRSVFFPAHGVVNAVGVPLAIILGAGLLAVALKAAMIAALGALSWATALAATAAGATGVAGFSWYCLQKLGEKGAEHALTSKL